MGEEGRNRQLVNKTKHESKKNGVPEFTNCLKTQ